MLTFLCTFTELLCATVALSFIVGSNCRELQKPNQTYPNYGWTNQNQTQLKLNPLKQPINQPKMSHRLIPRTCRPWPLFFKINFLYIEQETMEFSLNVFTEFAEFSDKKKSLQQRIRNPATSCVWDQHANSHKLSLIHVSVIYQFPWIRWIHWNPVLFRENSNLCEKLTVFCCNFQPLW